MANISLTLTQVQGRDTNTYQVCLRHDFAFVSATCLFFCSLNMLEQGPEEDCVCVDACVCVWAAIDLLVSVLVCT
jgi:hypothetical protein